MGAGVVRCLHTRVCFQLRRLKGNFRNYRLYSCKAYKNFGGGFSSLVGRELSPLQVVQETVGLNFSLDI